MEKYVGSIGEWFGLEERWWWAAELGLVVLVVVTINLLVRLLLMFISKATQNTTTLWDDALIKAISPPLRFVTWVVGLSIAAQLAASQVEAGEMTEYISKAREVGIIAALFWFIHRLAYGFQDKAIEKAANGDTNLDEHTAEAIGKLVRATIAITGALVVFQTMGFSVSGVLAFGGVGGIAIGFAARDMLANFFGGLMIYLDKPFSVGDWIRSPDKQIEGTVEQIGWRRTVVRKFDKRPLYVPNAIFTNISVENPSRMTNRRIKETIGIRYCDADKMTKIVADVKAMLRARDDIDQRQTMIVNFDAFNDSSMDFFIYTFTKTTVWVEFHEIKHDVMLQVYDIIRQHGGDCAYPSTSVYIESMPEIQAEKSA